MFLLLYLNIDGNINRLEYSDRFFVLFTVLICSDSIFNLLKRVTEGSFLFLCKKLVFLFLLFLNLGAQIRCPQNRYTDTLDQPLSTKSMKPSENKSTGLAKVLYFVFEKLLF